MTISLAAVFIPLFMGGILGTIPRVLRHHRRRHSGLGLRIGTLTPMLSARFLKTHHGEHGRLYNFTGHLRRHAASL
jgi:multidrug efflux pump subunit AcrB